MHFQRVFMYAIQFGIMPMLVLMCMVLSASTNHAHAASDTCKQIVVGGAAGWEPISYFDSNGHAQGISIDILRRYTQENNISLKVHFEIPWNRSIQMLEAGEIDVMAGAYYTAERAMTFIYSLPYAFDDVVVFQHVDRQFSVQNIESLIGHSGARPQGGSYGDFIDRYAIDRLDMIYSPTGNRIFDILMNGRVDYVLLGRYDGMANISLDGIEQQVIAIEPPLAVNEVQFMFSRNSPCVPHIARINDLITELESNGQLSEWVALHLPKSNSN